MDVPVPQVVEEALFVSLRTHNHQITSVKSPSGNSATSFKIRISPASFGTSSEAWDLEFRIEDLILLPVLDDRICKGLYPLIRWSKPATAYRQGFGRFIVVAAVSREDTSPTCRSGRRVEAPFLASSFRMFPAFYCSGQHCRHVLQD